MRRRYLVQFVNDVENDREGTATNDLAKAYQLARSMAVHADVRILDQANGRVVTYIPHRVYKRRPHGR